MITYSELRETLTYNAETGIFYWAKNVRNRKPGDVAGSLKKYGYIDITIDRKSYAAHRLAWLYVHGRFPPYQIDHINRIKTDNRLCNLRAVSPAENCWNRPTPKNKHGFKGVSFNKKRGRFVSSIRVNGLHRYLGSYSTAGEAATAYEVASKELHGIYSSLHPAEPAKPLRVEVGK